MIITITNQKGGVAKSTTSQNLGAGLANRGYKVLLIDLDAQANLTLSCGVKEPAKTVYSILKDKTLTADAITPIKENLSLIPASLALSTADLELNGVGKEYKLAEALESVKNDYDYIIIDTPPALSILTVNALTVADKVIIPAQADLFSLEAIKQLNNTIETIRRYTNKGLTIAGILLARYNNRNILTQELTEVLNTTAEYLQTKVFKNTIREAVAIKEAQARKQDIFTYSPESNVAGDYNGFVEEVIKDSIRK